MNSIYEPVILHKSDIKSLSVIKATNHIIIDKLKPEKFIPGSTLLSFITIYNYFQSLQLLMYLIYDKFIHYYLV